jgi:hypothetical protein
VSAKVEAVVLALDPAKGTSGACIIAPDYGNSMLGEAEHDFAGDYTLVEFGKVETQVERGRFVESFLETAEELGLPLVVVAEEWDPPRNRKLRLPDGAQGLLMDPKWTYETVLGIGEGWGRWAAELETASAFLAEEHDLPPIPVIRVLPNTWRDDFFGPGRPKESLVLKETACRYFETIFGFAASYDISEAGCIGLWGTTAPSVSAAVVDWASRQEAAEKAAAAKQRLAKNRQKRRR